MEIAPKISAFEAAGRAVCLYDYMHRKFYGSITGQSCKFLGGLHSSFLASSARLARMGELLTTNIEQKWSRGGEVLGVSMNHIREFQNMMAIVRSAKFQMTRPTLLQGEEIDAGYYGKHAEMNAAWYEKYGKKTDDKKTDGTQPEVPTEDIEQ